MKGYIGEFPIDNNDGMFKEFDKRQWVMYFIEHYGQIHGEHHKAWVLDQVARILMDTPVEIKLAIWDNGYQEYRVSTGEPSQEYLDWVAVMEQDEYEYDAGIAP
jgi:hypothetical protein